MTSRTFSTFSVLLTCVLSLACGYQFADAGGDVFVEDGDAPEGVPAGQITRGTTVGQPLMRIDG